MLDSCRPALSGPYLPRAPRPQARLLQVDWPQELLALAPAAPLSLEGVPVYRGLRLAMGMTGGRLVEVRPCGRSGKAEFFGPLLNQAARIASMANGGQVRRRRVAGRAD